MATEFYLINDDQPGNFRRRVARVTRDDVRLGEQAGVMVAIEPPIENLKGGPLDTALLLPRHIGTSVDDLRSGAIHPVSVFVCRVLERAKETERQLSKEDVSISFWGLVSASPDFGGRA
jgi:hypothetical protein